MTTGQSVVDDLGAKHPETDFQLMSLELSSFDSVKKCAADFNSRYDRLDILFLNAGIGMTAARLSAEGYESHFGVNHMGHALLTQLLLPKMLQTKRQHQDADVRITVTSSIAAVKIAPTAGLVLAEMHNPDAFQRKFTRYGHSKLANILFARKLNQSYPSIMTTSTHPGTVKTEIWNRGDGSTLISWLTAPAVWLTGTTVEEGAKTQLWAATAKDVEGGTFYVPIGKTVGGTASSNSQEQTDELWEYTERELAKHGGPGWPEA
ncbi:hypothetical protein LTR08_001977 [Meristemomyces frigidus]|nr:hypothetical protein LTR08_001977 [Meristemomyces frigidus]